MQFIITKDNSIKYDFADIISREKINLKEGQSAVGFLRVGESVKYKYYHVNEKSDTAGIGIFKGRIIYLSKTAATIDMSIRYTEQVSTVELPDLLEFILFEKSDNVEGASTLSHVLSNQYTDNVEYKSGDYMIITDQSQIIHIGDTIEIYDESISMTVTGKLKKIALENDNISFLLDTSNKCFGSSRKIYYHGILRTEENGITMAEFKYEIKQVWRT